MIYVESKHNILVFYTYNKVFQVCQCVLRMTYVMNYLQNPQYFMIHRNVAQRCEQVDHEIMHLMFLFTL